MKGERAGRFLLPRPLPLSRLAAAPFLFNAIWGGSSGLALFFFVFGAVSDLVDGRIQVLVGHRLQHEPNFGRLGAGNAVTGQQQPLRPLKSKSLYRWLGHANAAKLDIKLRVTHLSLSPVTATTVESCRAVPLARSWWSKPKI